MGRIVNSKLIPQFSFMFLYIQNDKFWIFLNWNLSINFYNKNGVIVWSKKASDMAILITARTKAQKQKQIAQPRNSLGRTILDTEQGRSWILNDTLSPVIGCPRLWQITVISQHKYLRNLMTNKKVLFLTKLWRVSIRDFKKQKIWFSE